MANAVRVDGTTAFGDKDGAGRLDFSNSLFGKWFWWNGNNASWFSTDADGDGRLEIDATDTLSAGSTYHVVLSWLVSGTYVRTNLKPNMDIDLRVVAPNGAIFSSSSVANNYEMVKFTAPVAGTYHFYVERFWNSGTGDVRVGLVVRQR